MVNSVWHAWLQIPSSGPLGEDEDDGDWFVSPLGSDVAFDWVRGLTNDFSCRVSPLDSDPDFDSVEGLTVVPDWMSSQETMIQRIASFSLAARLIN